MTEKWVERRRQAPCIHTGGASGTIQEVKHNRNTKNAQKPYTTLTHTTATKNGEVITYRALFLPFDIEVNNQVTWSLAAASDAPGGGLMTYTKPPGAASGALWMHSTSVFRMQHLAETHPLVTSIAQSKHSEQKLKEITTYNEFGRATKYHQSPYDLELEIAAPGAKPVMEMAYTVNNVSSELGCAWWHWPGGAHMLPEHAELCDAVFYDLCGLTPFKQLPEPYASISAASGAHKVPTEYGKLFTSVFSSLKKDIQVSASSTVSSLRNAAVSAHNFIVEAAAAPAAAAEVKEEPGRPEQQGQATGPAPAASGAAAVPAATAPPPSVPGVTAPAPAASVAANEEQPKSPPTAQPLSESAAATPGPSAPQGAASPTSPDWGGNPTTPASPPGADGAQSVPATPLHIPGPAAPATPAATGADVVVTIESGDEDDIIKACLLYTSPSPRDGLLSRMPSSA